MSAAVCAHGLLSAPLCTSLDAIRIQPGPSWRAIVGDRVLEEGSGPALRAPLVAALYEVLHSGHRQGSARSRSLRIPAFEKQLVAATPHETAAVRANLVQAPEDAGDAIVEIAGVRVRVPSTAVHVDRPWCAGDAVTVDIPAARPALSPGFFLADGSHGPAQAAPFLRVYVHVASPESAPQLWHKALVLLEEAGVPYRAKILSSPDAYPRTDALVIYLGADTWPRVKDVPPQLAELGGTSPGTSVFTQELAAGVALAWEPDDGRPGRTRLSFGEHRATAVADALIRHASGESGLSRDQAIHDALTEANADPLAPERNINSPTPGPAR